MQELSEDNREAPPTSTAASGSLDVNTTRIPEMAAESDSPGTARESRTFDQKYVVDRIIPHGTNEDPATLRHAKENGGQRSVVWIQRERQYPRARPPPPSQ